MSLFVTNVIDILCCIQMETQLRMKIGSEFVDLFETTFEWWDVRVDVKTFESIIPCLELLNTLILFCTNVI